MHKRNGDSTPYPVEKQQVIGNTLRWTFSEDDASKKGYGEGQIIFSNSDGSVIGKSDVFKTVVSIALEDNETDLDPAKNWSTRVSSVENDLRISFDHIDTLEMKVSELVDLKNSLDEIMDEASNQTLSLIMSNVLTDQEAREYVIGGNR